VHSSNKNRSYASKSIVEVEKLVNNIEKEGF
jgi:hypothetical protein